MKLVNFFGGPGTGKSSMAAGVFSKLKFAGVTCEYVTEYAKELTWEKSSKLKDQLYITGKQQQRIRSVGEQVDFIITDAPLINGLLYNKEHTPEYEALVLNLFNSYENINFFLYRQKLYNPVGRTQTEEQAKELDIKIKGILNKNNIPYFEFDGIENNVSIITDTILREK